MARACLTIDLDNIVANWRALDAMTATACETGAVVKADAYGLGIGPVASALAAAGATTFFVALAEEGVELRDTLGPGPEIFVFSGYMSGDREAYDGAALVPCLNSPEQMSRFRKDLPGRPCAIQIDTGMNRLGFEPVDLAAGLLDALTMKPRLIMSHLACGDLPTDPMNGIQLAAMHTMTVPMMTHRRSLASTAGTLLGSAYHLDMTRPGIGLFGGMPFEAARPVVTLSLPVIQVRDVLPQEIVGYGGTYRAQKPIRVATLSAGYADGLIRAIGGKAKLYAGDVACPLVGRVSMDLITADVTALGNVPSHLDILCDHQGIDDLAKAAGTIGFEILTSLGSRYARVYKGLPEG